tara:strand:+ start:832 stop:1326 length:495 start_codon:yes stop_codon:yes gene_type:complete
MAYGNQFKATPISSITTADTAQLYPLGSTYLEPADEVVANDSSHEGDRLWVYVKGGSGGITTQSVVARATGTSPFTGIIGVAANTAVEVIGVSTYAIAADSYGWVIRRGCAEADGNSVTQGVDIVPAADGEVNDTGGAGAEDHIIGTALDAASGAVGTVFLTLA